MGSRIEYLGYPPHKVLRNSLNITNFFDVNIPEPNIRNSSGVPVIPNSRSLMSASYFQRECLLYDFLETCLNIDPDKRATAAQLYSHEWLTELPSVPQLPPGLVSLPWWWGDDE